MIPALVGIRLLACRGSKVFREPLIFGRRRGAAGPKPGVGNTPVNRAADGDGHAAQ